MNYTLKEATYAEVTTLVNEAIDTQGFVPLKADKHPFLLTIPDVFEGDPDYHLFVLLERQSHQAGFIIILPHAAPQSVSIGPMYIRKPYRGKGLGTHLVNAVLEWSHANGIASVFTQTWGKNIASRRIFEHAGFQQIGEDVDTRVNGDSTVKYQFAIQPQGLS